MQVEDARPRDLLAVRGDEAGEPVEDEATSVGSGYEDDNDSDVHFFRRAPRPWVDSSEVTSASSCGEDDNDSDVHFFRRHMRASPTSSRQPRPWVDSSEVTSASSCGEDLSSDEEWNRLGCEAYRGHLPLYMPHHPPDSELICRICLGDSTEQEEAEAENGEDLTFVAPCVCRGSGKYVHLACLKTLFRTRGDWHDFRCKTCNQLYSGYALLHLAEISRGHVLAETNNRSLAFARTLFYLGMAHSQLGNVRLSKRLFEQSVTIKERYHGGGHASALTALSHLASVYGRLGNTLERGALLQEVKKSKLKHLPLNHPSVATTLNNLALAHGALGEFGKKRELLEKSLHIKRASFGNDDVRLAATLSNLAVVYGEEGNLTAKKELLEQALAISERHYGEGHIKTATTLHNLAHVRGEMGELLQSKLLLEKSLAIQEQHYGIDYGDMALTLASLGIAYATLADHDLAAVSCTRCVYILQGEMAPCAQICGVALMRVATVEHACGDLAWAEDLRLRGITRMRDAGGRERAQRVTAKCQRMAAIWRAAGVLQTAAWVEGTALIMRVCAPRNSPRGTRRKG